MDILPVSEDKLSKPYAFAKITIRVKNIFQCLPAGANSFTYLFLKQTNVCEFLRILAGNLMMCTFLRTVVCMNN